MAFFDGLKGEPARQPVPVTPPAAKPPVDVELTQLITPSTPTQRGRLGSAAFAFFKSLGDSRTFVQVAREFGVTESAVARYAKRHGWEKRIHLEDPVRVAEVSREVQVRVRQKAGDLVSVDPAGDAEKVRRVRNELLATGLELLELGKAHLASVAIAEPKDVMRCIELGAKLMQAATESDADKGTADVVLLMRQKLQALTAAPPEQFIEKKENDNG